MKERGSRDTARGSLQTGESSPVSQLAMSLTWIDFVVASSLGLLPTCSSVRVHDVHALNYVWFHCWTVTQTAEASMDRNCCEMRAIVMGERYGKMNAWAWRDSIDPDTIDIIPERAEVPFDGTTFPILQD